MSPKEAQNERKNNRFERKRLKSPCMVRDHMEGKFEPLLIISMDGSSVKTILLRRITGPSYALWILQLFALGYPSFAIFNVTIINLRGGITKTDGLLPIVWSANRNNLVRKNATLELTSEGDLILRDDHGIVMWPKFDRNDKLFFSDVNNLVVWQYFDHPTQVRTHMGHVE
ncbi:Receptor-like serine/threonine-protein kinase [Abeliophyllum distichum]|uniref:Receptor-like serine/threonine-protein kinase n=1 Tax=Abeliophyllum distichum TaxID=126358 RepID=A0ABD1QK76_9LAMI